jgi:hypothetical protein
LAVHHDLILTVYAKSNKDFEGETLQHGVKPGGLSLSFFDNLNARIGILPNHEELPV